MPQHEEARDLQQERETRKNRVLENQPALGQPQSRQRSLSIYQLHGLPSRLNPPPLVAASSSTRFFLDSKSSLRELTATISKLSIRNICEALPQSHTIPSTTTT